MQGRAGARREGRPASHTSRPHWCSRALDNLILSCYCFTVNSRVGYVKFTIQYLKSTARAGQWVRTARVGVAPGAVGERLWVGREVWSLSAVSVEHFCGLRAPSVAGACCGYYMNQSPSPVCAKPPYSRSKEEWIYGGKVVCLPSHEVARAFDALLRRGGQGLRRRRPTEDRGDLLSGEIDKKCGKGSSLDLAPCSSVGSGENVLPEPPPHDSRAYGYHDCFPSAEACKRKQPESPQPRHEEGSTPVSVKELLSVKRKISFLRPRPQRGGLTPSCFDYGRFLGRGKFGDVWLARERQSGYLVAIKSMSKATLTGNGMEIQFRREVEAQTQLRHTNIIRLLDVLTDSWNVYLVLEFAPKGSLRSLLNRTGALAEALCATYVVQIGNALEYCHSKRIIHRDLKPDNILLGHKGEIKVADFGSCVHTISGRRLTAVGTFGYVSPEILKGHDHGPPCDVWSLGVVLYEMLTAELPFGRWEDALSPEPRYRPIAVHSDVTMAPDSLLGLLLRPDPCKRMPLWELPWHPWVRSLVVSAAS